MYKFLKLKKSTDGKHKYEAIFLNTENNREKTVKFGAIKKNGEPYEDFTTHGDEKRKERYIKRHDKREDFENPITAASLSRYISWNLPTIEDSLKDYLKRFKNIIS
jgi:hypothetical protein